MTKQKKIKQLVHLKILLEYILDGENIYTYPLNYFKVLKMLVMIEKGDGV